MWVFLHQISSFISTSFYLPSGIHCQESYKCSGDLRDLPIFNHLLSTSPIQLSHCGLEVTFSLYTDLIHVQVVFAVQTATRLGTVREMALFKRGKSYLDFFALARVFSIAFIQGGFTSSPSCMRSFMEVLLALHLRSLTCFCGSTRAEIRQGFVTPLIGR